MSLRLLSSSLFHAEEKANKTRRQETAPSTVPQCVAHGTTRVIQWFRSQLPLGNTQRDLNSIKSYPFFEYLLSGIKSFTGRSCIFKDDCVKVKRTLLTPCASTYLLCVFTPEKLYSCVINFPQYAWLIKHNAILKAFLLNSQYQSIGFHLAFVQCISVVGLIKP